MKFVTNFFVFCRRNNDDRNKRKVGKFIKNVRG